MTELNLEQINWNKLTPEEFQKINEQLLSDRKLVKSSQRAESKVTGTEIVTLMGKTYQIPASVYIRLKKMKSEKSKQKLIDKIISENNPIEEL